LVITNLSYFCYYNSYVPGMLMSSLLVESVLLSLTTVLTVDVTVVTERVCRHQHKLSEVTLHVVMLDAQPDVDVRAVQVSGILTSHSNDFISLYFESNKRSGGGPIDELIVDRDKGTAVITFTSPHSTILSCHVLFFLFMFLKFLYCRDRPKFGFGFGFGLFSVSVEWNGKSFHFGQNCEWFRF